MSDFWERSRVDSRDRDEERSVSILVYESERVARAAVDCSVSILSETANSILSTNLLNVRTYVVYHAQTGFYSARFASTDASFSARL